MITEDYISFETAKLLKERGFNGLCTAYYDCFTTDNFHCGYEPTDFNSIDTKIRNIVAAPTLQMAMKWLREEHNLHCNSDYDIILGWYCQITSLTETVEYDYEEMKHYHPDNDHGFSSSAEACEAAIKYCLENLI